MAAVVVRAAAPVERVEVAAYTIPTERPESDGTFEWDATTVVLVEIDAGGVRGLGFSYADEAAVTVVERRLAPAIAGLDALDVGAAWARMVASVRNVGLGGVAATAIAAVDIALWDLKAKFLEVPLVKLLGAARERVPLYASGGFTSSNLSELHDQLAGWAAQGFTRAKLKVGRFPHEDLERVRAAREGAGPRVELFVDANGAYSRKQALAFAEEFAHLGVTWFEEPVVSADIDGLRLLRDRAPAPIEIAAGEYCHDVASFRLLLAGGAVDVLQADATRCLGITGFLAAAALSDAFGVPLSAHTAPAVHLHPCCALANVRHLEWFQDHVRIERLLFDGLSEPVGGDLLPDLARPGLGIEFRRSDADRYLVR